MKKIFVLLGLAAMTSAVAVGVGAKTGLKQAKADSPATDLGEQTYVVTDELFVDDDDFKEVKVVDADTTYWDSHQSTLALDRYLSTGYHNNFPADNPNHNYDNEGFTGTITSKTWLQKTQYVYFQWGAALDDGEGERIVFHYGVDWMAIYNNTFSDGRMLLRYFKIPDAVYSNLDKVNGFSMYFEIIDERTNNWGLHNFGYFHPNATLESTADAMRLYLNSILAAPEDVRRTIQNHYFANTGSETGLKEVFFSTVSTIDENFGSNSDFLNHWYFDWDFFNNDGTEKHFDKIISTFGYRPDNGHNVPFNNEGGFFKGWYADNTNNTGFTATDAAVYRFRSRAFELANPGVISIKMGGRGASLHVIDVATNTVLGWVDNYGRNYQASGDIHNAAESGFNTCTMRRFVINLEAYVGRTIQLAIADVHQDLGNWDWETVYFDELVVNNPIATFGYKVDSVSQTNDKVIGKNELNEDIHANVTTYASFCDYYVSSEWVVTAENGFAYDTNNDINTSGEHPIRDHVDNSDFKAAFDCVSYFYDNFRGNGSYEYLNCSSFDGSKVQTLVNKYSRLSANAKIIVDNSQDTTRGNDTTKVWYQVQPIRTAMVGDVIVAIQTKTGTVPEAVTPSNFFQGMLGGENSIVVILIIGASFALVLLTAFLFVKKKKQN